jgi:hypothetical protein
MSSVQAVAEHLRVIAEGVPDFGESAPVFAEGGPAYTDTPGATGRGRTFSPEGCGLSCGCALPSALISGELLRLSQTTRANVASRARVQPGHVLTLDLTRITRRP